MKRKIQIPKKIFTVLILIVMLIAVNAFRVHDEVETNPPAHNSFTEKDSVASVMAFGKVYTVLMSPRCMNCHPAGDVPLQGDDSHLHQMAPKRGKDGKGVTAMKCSNCHQPTNIPGVGTPPGNPKWALPPADMKMVFEGKTARQLAIQITDYKQNGHKNTKQLIEHARDTLVKAGWSMGENRKPPPLSYDEFVIAWDTWINKGAFIPAE